MTDKIYGGYQPATVGTATRPDYPIYPAYERLEGADGAWDSERLAPKARADESPIEDVLNRANLTVDRLFNLTDKLHCRLEPYMKQAVPEAANEKLGYLSPSSALGQAIYDLEARLRALECHLESMHSRIER